MKQIKLHQLVLAAISGAVLFTVPVGAENASDPAPEIKPSQPNGQKVLFDNTHAQTAGAADWVIDGAFSDFGQGLANNGYYVKELRKTTPITLDDLKEYDVFVLPEANIPYKVSEQQAIEDYVSAGGSVFYISDHYNADRNKNRIDASEAFNGYRRGAYTDMTKDMSEAEKNSEAMQGVESSDWLNETFGVRFRYNGIDNISDSSKWVMNDAFGILDGVNSVGLHAGSTVAIMDPTRAKGLIYPPSGLTSSANKWGPSVDQGVYNGGGVEEGAYVAISKKDKGKAAFIGDTSMVEDASPKYMRDENGKSKKTYDGYKEKDDAKVLVQLVDWLSKQEDYDTFDKMGIQLSSKTVLHDFEDPAKSTEPQKEPWAAPAAGFKWYDNSTFAPGSFGTTSTVQVPSEGKVSIELKEKPQAKRDNKAVVKVTGLAPNAKADNYQLGLYTPVAQNGFTQGSQVAKTKVGDGEWLPIGYSEKFSVTADANGNAEQVVYFNVQAEGDYNIRVKQNKDNLVTNPITILPFSETEGPTDPEVPETPKDEANYDVTGKIAFEKNDGSVKPIDPENPKDNTRPINPDGSEPNNPAGGLLSVDYASSFSFGKQAIENQGVLYGAQPQQFKDSDLTRGNYVQVSDRRGSNAGWVLSIVQNEQFKTAANEELTGAKLYLGNGSLNSPSMLEESFLPETAPTNLVKQLTATTDKVTGGLELIPGQSSIIMSADKGKGNGTWTLSYGQTKDNNIGLVGNNNPSKSSVILSIPSSSNATSSSYESTLTYRLSMVPAP
ncbi:WxL domain-containing protein [Vagococcus sp. DIV0080]|uniref:WxL domain-containing protein n=1 Tax=Candidatus Vagococcus giribetii TaxID=2230876 RepID=A0ABS3HXK9_9ENTE|nr:WxL domain-containing protein [Vagococcus sp. DIV0080]MBO0477546.1 WxL domain-containing protein [Vagococcus sp. DIV0080]